ncbi:MAG: hypothetical protein KDD58_06400 [Bdellovibrionales bacterium]|nr:hypothetical protein [Bdellovibrionales bacterium]
MKTPVYRNLDKPFQVLGLSVTELISLSFVLIIGNELSNMLSIQQTWSFAFTFVIALFLFWIRYSLGQKFALRLIRFIKLPDKLNEKMYISNREKF